MSADTGWNGVKEMKRIQRKRIRGWRMPPNTVYVGRPGKWGNPFKWQDADADVIPKNIAKECAKESFETWLTRPGVIMDIEHLEPRRQWILDNIHELAGKDLACWCRVGECCHADVLLELARQLPQNEKEGI